MKTNQVIKTTISGFDIVQRKDDGMFNATLLLKQWNSESGNERKLDNYFLKIHTKSLITSLTKLNGKNPYIRSRISRGENVGTWMCPAMFLDFVEYLSIDLYVSVKEYFLERNIIDKDVKSESIRDEIIHLSNVYDAIKVSCDNVFSMLQYPCCDSKYWIDLLVYRDTDFPCDNGLVTTNRNVTIIEYDEEHHNRTIKQDIEREKDIAKYLVESIKGEGKNPFIEITRIKRGQEPQMYAYIIPYLTGIETSYTFDKISKEFDMRVLYEEESE